MKCPSCDTTTTSFNVESARVRPSGSVAMGLGEVWAVTCPKCRAVLGTLLPPAVAQNIAPSQR